MSYKDKTLLDNDRTPISFQRSEVERVLPEYFAEEYPQLIKLFDAYYEWMDTDDNPGSQIKKLQASRDATQVPDKLLQFLEDELLLGQAYFGGFQNKREAIKFSNLLYRSKGTKYSIEQFFRGFFGADPQVIYPKDDIFKVGPSIDYELDSTNRSGQQIRLEASVLGPESRKFITDDKLYQVMSILIRVGIPVRDWLEVYKLFVHPAGVYVGSELLLEYVNTNTLKLIQDEVGDPITELVSNTFEGLLSPEGFVETSLLNFTDIDNTTMQRQIVNQDFGKIGDKAINTVMAGRSDFNELLGIGTLSMDDTGIVMSEDSAGNVFLKATMDNAPYNTLFDSIGNNADSAHYPFQHL
jgi:hypothetical protein